LSLGDELVLQRTRLHAFLSPLSDDQALHRYAPGKWSVKEMVGHLADAERIQAYRMLRIGRGDTAPLPGFEEDDYVRAAGSDARPFADLLRDWNAARESTIALVKGMPDEAWERRGTANDATVSARALAYIILGHVEHHLGVLEDRYGLTGR
jgi:uncharacterized damage-inducible protein DinB